MAAIVLKGVGNTDCLVHFVAKESELKNAKLDVARNRYDFYYLHSSFQNIIDMLRNESPVHVKFMTATNSRLTTGAEIVGEGDGP